MPAKKRKPAKKIQPTPTNILGCNIQMGPAKHEVTREVADAVQAIARAVEANARAAQSLADALRGPELHLHGNGIHVGGTQ